jgi:hypothetical protein
LFLAQVDKDYFHGSYCMENKPTEDFRVNQSHLGSLVSDDQELAVRVAIYTYTTNSKIQSRG